MFITTVSCIRPQGLSATKAHQVAHQLTQVARVYVAVLLCGLASMIANRVQAQTSPMIFTYTGTVQTFTVPADVTTLTVVANGAQGGGSTGGKGGRVTATLTVTPGQSFSLYVGGVPFNGGGSSAYGPGGGATDIRIGGTSLSNRVLVAGGGGGADQAAGGAGGGLTGGNGTNSGDYYAGGSGGSQTAVGVGSGNGSNGTFGGGGAANSTGAGNSNGNGGGGGGGGYYGGGAGHGDDGGGAGGGGGSSYTDLTLCTNVVHEQGINEGNGSITLSWEVGSVASCTAPTVSLLNTGAGSCVGLASLSVVTNQPIGQLNWYNGNSLLLSATPESVTAGVTVAGGNGAGSNANQLNSPMRVFVDGNGAVYVAEANNHRIQKWAAGAASGTTVAGGNGAGNADNQLNVPFGVFVDGSGAVYVADRDNHRIQKWAAGASSGITVAGGNGAGSAANQLNSPYAVYVDGSGAIYVSDNQNHRVQKWAAGATSGITVAGGNGWGSAANQLNVPQALYVDGSGAVYVADEPNHRIQKWAAGASTGITVAGGNGQGNAANQFNSPTAVWGDNFGSIYVADRFNQRIQKFPLNSTSATNGTTVAGNGTAGSAANQFSSPYGLCIDELGAIYVADQNNNRIQKWAVSQVFVPITNGTYTAQITSQNGCTATTNVVVVSLPPSVSISASPSLTVTSGNNLTLTASGTDSFTWSNGLSGSAITVSNITSATTLSVTCITGGCSSTATVSISVQPAAPTLTASASLVCAGSPLNVTAACVSGTVSFSASGAAGSASGSIYTFDSGTPKGVYSLSAICVNDGLSSTVTALATSLTIGEAVAITQHPVASSVVCAGVAVSVPVSVTGTGAQFQWYKNGSRVDGQNIATLSLPSPVTADAGTYSLVVTGGCNSTTSTAFSLTVNSIPTVTISPTTTTIKGGESVTLTASGVGSYTWNTNDTAAQLVKAPTQTTVYSVSSAANGCSASASATVVVDCGELVQPNAISVTQTAVLGPGNCSVTLQGQGYGNGYTITGPGGYVFSAVYRKAGSYTLHALDVKLPGTYTFTVSYSDACGRSSSDTRTYVVTGTVCK